MIQINVVLSKNLVRDFESLDESNTDTIGLHYGYTCIIRVICFNVQKCSLH